jgi:hypothetical protein
VTPVVVVDVPDVPSVVHVTDKGGVTPVSVAVSTPS